MTDSDKGGEDKADDALVEAKRAAIAARKALIAGGGGGNWILPVVVTLAVLLNLAARLWGGGYDGFGIDDQNFWDHLWSTAYVGGVVVAVWKLIAAIKSR